jgi:hypothetical protein
LLAFPGVFRGALDSGAQVINEEMKVAAAMTLAAIVIEPAPERILPDPLNKSVGFRIGEAVAAARKSGCVGCVGTEGYRLPAKTPLTGYGLESGSALRVTRVVSIRCRPRDAGRSRNLRAVVS